MERRASLISSGARGGPAGFEGEAAVDVVLAKNDWLETTAADAAPEPDEPDESTGPADVVREAVDAPRFSNARNASGRREGVTLAGRDTAGVPVAEREARLTLPVPGFEALERPDDGASVFSQPAGAMGSSGSTDMPRPLREPVDCISAVLAE